jgi:hypothetical protein
MKILPAYNFFLTPRCIMQEGVKLQIKVILRSEATNEKLLGYDSETHAGFCKKNRGKKSLVSVSLSDRSYISTPTGVYLCINYYQLFQSLI